MTVEVIVPPAGMGVTDVIIVEWLKKVGDHVEKDEPLVNAMAYKATFDIKSPASGILKEIRIEANKEVPLGEVIAIIDTGED